MNTAKHSELGRIDLLDYARFAAALIVVLYHYFFVAVEWHHVPGISFFPYVSHFVKYGYLGVHLFFIISGYVIFYSARNRTASQFAVARAVRLYPAFIAALCLTTIVAYFGHDPKHIVYASQFIVNLTMLPQLFGRGPADPSYWTLPLEIYFYAMVLLFLLVTSMRTAEKFFVVWPFLILATVLAGGDEWLLFGGLYSFFAAGVLFAMKRTDKRRIVKIGLLTCFYVSLRLGVRSASADTTSLPANPFIVISIISTYYGLFWLLGIDSVRSIRLPKARQIGALTYPLYLIHQLIGFIVLSRYATEANKLIAFPLMVAVMLAIAYLINRGVEVRLAGFWRHCIEKLIGTPIAMLSGKLFRAGNSSQTQSGSTGAGRFRR